jgi:YidC/Oxa1 family membrane protein insertase
MKVIKPEMDEIQKRYKNKRDMDDQLSMQRELSELYQKHDFNPVKMVSGCLPMIIQMPFLIGFYYAIRRTSEIAEQPFLWFNLGETDLLLVLVAVLVYFIQARVSLIGMDQKNQGLMGMMAYISPIMIGVISLTTPAALPLYWTIGGLFMVAQTIIIKKYVLN